MVFGATEIERQYIHFDSPIRWFQHRVPLEQLAPQFHKLYQDQFKKSERVKEIKTELERGWFPWDVWTVWSTTDRTA